jgi:deoxycytidylate deaminase
MVYYTAREMAMNNGMPFHLAACLKRGKSIIRIGVNQGKTNPRFIRSYKDGISCSTLHAEMDALIAARPGDSLIIVRWNKFGEITMSKPCQHCQRHIEESGIRDVIYSDWHGDFIKYRVQ